MDFLERYFQISPDGHSGLVEFAYIFAAVLAVVALLFRRPIARWARRLTSRPVSNRA